jgi:nitroreductase
MTDTVSAPTIPTSPRDVLRPLRQVRQYRQFTDEPITDDQMRAILDVARWTGSGNNRQPWRFIVLRDRDRIEALSEAGLPQTRTLRTAAAVIAVTLPDAPEGQLSLAYDEGRCIERILIAASMIGLGAGISWVRTEVKEALEKVIGVPEGQFVRTIVAVGHPTEEARALKNPGQPARLPLDEVLLSDL